MGVVSADLANTDGLITLTNLPTNMFHTCMSSQHYLKTLQPFVQKDVEIHLGLSRFILQVFYLIFN